MNLTAAGDLSSLPGKNARSFWLNDVVLHLGSFAFSGSKQVMVVRKSPETGEDWKVIFDIDGYGDSKIST